VKQPLIIIKIGKTTNSRESDALEAYVDRLLYVSRDVVGEILTLLDEDARNPCAFIQQGRMLTSGAGCCLCKFGPFVIL